MAVDQKRIAKHARRRLRRFAAEDLDTGADWYAVESDRLADACASSGISREVAVTVAAILSPACPWDRLTRTLPSWFRARRWGRELPLLPGYGFNIRKATAYLEAIELGYRPESAAGIYLDPKKSPKVFRFRRNLLGDLDPVTVDRHAARAALGRAFTGGPNLGTYLAVESAYQTVAREVGLEPAQFQAGVWVHQRGF